MLGISSQLAAGKFEEQICHLAATQTFELVRQYLANFDAIDITETMIRETAENRGLLILRAEELAAEKITSASPQTTILYVQADGSMVPIRPKEAKNPVEYKEIKLGLVFREEDINRCPDGKCEIKKKRFATSLGIGVEHFEKLLKHTAIKSGALCARTIVFISDGSEWIDRMRQRIFPKSIHILDWYHAEEHLWNCAKAIFGESATAKTGAWVAPLKQMLWDGLAVAVCEQLLFETVRHPEAETSIRELYGYYKYRIDKMRYPEFRRKGYFIGSGAVESAHKYLVQARLKQAGMKWTIPGATAIIKLREKLYERTWTQVWGQRAA